MSLMLLVNFNFFSNDNLIITAAFDHFIEHLKVEVFLL